MEAGYAFRSQVDGRNHGAGAALLVDVPLPGPFALRPAVGALGFGGSDAAPSSLAFFQGALALVYSFDDSDLEALAAVGPLAGVVVDTPAGAAGPLATLHGGALAGIGLRVPIAGAVRLAVDVSVPFVVVGPKGFTAPGQQAYADGTLVELPLQTLFALGFVLDVDALFAGATDAPPARSPR